MKVRQNGTAMLILASLGLLIISAVVGAGCAAFTAPPSRSQGKQSEPRPLQQLKPADARVQQQYYDKGLQHYSRENYGDARKAFQHAVDLGPNTALGQKAQENLRKIQQIMKTVEEIESK